VQAVFRFSPTSNFLCTIIVMITCVYIVSGNVSVQNASLENVDTDADITAAAFRTARQQLVSIVFSLFKLSAVNKYFYRFLGCCC